MQNEYLVQKKNQEEKIITVTEELISELRDAIGNYKEIMSSHIKKIDSKKEMEDFSNTSNNSDNVSSYEFENNEYSFIKENEKNNIILNDKEGEIAMNDSKFNLSINRIRPKYSGVQHRILKKCRDSNNSVQNSQIINKKI